MVAQPVIELPAEPPYCAALALDQPMPYLVEAWTVGALGATFAAR